MKIRNRKVLSALTIGLSAMMTFTPTLTAFAAGGEPEDNTTSSGEENTSVTSITAEASAQCDVASEAISDAVDAVSDMMSVYEQSAPEASEGFVQSNPEVADLVDALADVSTVETVSAQAVQADGQGEAVQSEVQASNDIEAHLNETAEAVAEVKDQLPIIESANAEAEAEALDVVDSVVAAVDVADKAESAIETTKQEVASLITDAQTAGTKTEADQIVEKIDTEVKEAKEDLELKQEAFNKLVTQYDGAKTKLLEAQKKFETALATSSTAVAKAAEEVEKARVEVAQIEGEMKEAQAAISEEKASAGDIGSAMKLVDDDSKWDNQREVMKAFVDGYLIPQIEGESISNIKWERVQGIDKQDYNHVKLTYTDSRGETVTRFFNYDRIDKTQSTDPYKNLGTSKAIAVYEKSAEEIGANDYLMKKYDDKIPSNYSTLAKNGDFKVFAYTDDAGVTHYYDKTDLANAIASGEVTEDQVHEVIQNANSLVFGGGQAYLVAKDTASIEKFLTGNTAVARYLKEFYGESKGQELLNGAVATNAFMNSISELAEKYDTYTEATVEAKKAVETAKEEVENLETAIDTLTEASESNRILTACEVLGVDDVAEFLGLELSEEDAEALNEMTLEEAISYLDQVLENAKQKMDVAFDTYETVKKQADEVKGQLEDKFREAQPGSTQPDATGGDVVTIPDAGVPLSDFGSVYTAPAAESGTPSTGDIDSLVPGDIMTMPSMDGASAPAPAVLGVSLNDTGTSDSQGTTNINNPLVPKGNFTRRNTNQKDKGIVKITDDDPALAGTIPVEESAQMSWCWLFLIALFGAAGKAMYNKYRERKQTKTAA